MSDNNKEIPSDFIEKNYPSEFHMWMHVPYGSATHGTAEYSDAQIQIFIKSIFEFLSNARACFSAGSIVFNDVGKLLFNLLTYNKFLINSDTYNCNSPDKSSVEISRLRGFPKITSNLVSYITNHQTHNKVFTMNKGKPIHCIPHSKYTKFERLFNPKLEKLCEPNTSETKGVLLYYPFRTGEEDTQLLFFKLERDEMMSIGHLSKSASTYLGNQFDNMFGTKIGVHESPENGIDRYTGLDMRREDRNRQNNPKECDYDIYFKNKDTIFYKKYYKILGFVLDDYTKRKIKEDVAELEWYNENVRTGCEFYVTKNLLAFMIEHIFVPRVGVVFRNINLNEETKTSSSSKSSKNRNASNNSKSRRNRKSTNKVGGKSEKNRKYVT
jgi:hypothetical protein